MDYGNGPRVWVDAFGEEGDAVLRAFCGVLESESVRKVWHNYGFDRHVLYNHGIDARGFHGDTMHMARLQNTARLDKATGGGYSLVALSRLLLNTPPKVPMLDLFGKYKLKKNGEEGKVRELPHLAHIQRSPDPSVRRSWVGYSVMDAEVTWRLHARLTDLLSDPVSARWRPESVCFADVQPLGSVNILLPGKSVGGERDSEKHPPTLAELYHRVLAPFGECLTDMERRGIALDLEAIGRATVEAEAERLATISRFQNWAVEFMGKPDLKWLNVHSDMQKAQFLFGLPKATPASAANEKGDKQGASGGGGGGGGVDGALFEGEDGGEDEIVVDVLAAAAAAATSRKGLKAGSGLGVMKRSGKAVEAATPYVAVNALISAASTPPSVSVQEDSAKNYPSSSDGGGGSGVSLGSRAFSTLSLTTVMNPCRLSDNIMVDSGSGFIGLESSTSDSEGEWHVQGGENDSEAEGGGNLSFQGGRRGSTLSTVVAADLGVLLGPSGFTQRIPGPEEDLCPEYEFETENTEGWVEPGKVKPKKKRPFLIPSLLLPITDRTPKGRASGTAGAIKKLVAKSPLGGGSVAYQHLLSRGCSPLVASEGVDRISDLLSISSIDTVLETFLEPLHYAASTSPDARVHCSLNLNTETGRLSARRPNLQNQPSLERDKFGIRKAFVAPPGRSLLVADYGQLELRILAHLTHCKSMINAFAAGGDFHSRTAIGMYPHVREAVEKGKVLLEAMEGGEGGGAPLLKDVFKEERRKAKILNFSIAYGKTAFGLAKDWGVSLSDAEATVKAWYSDRPEVLEWQVKTRESARRTGKVFTILGRQRDLPGINVRRTAGHSERAAINTPIQGSAADIVMCAMLRIASDPMLKEWGYAMVLQIHDEVVLEGPSLHAHVAMARLKELMEKPFDKSLLVALEVDAKVVQSWGDAK